MYTFILNNLYKWFLIPLTLSSQLYSSYASSDSTWHRDEAGCTIGMKADNSLYNKLPSEACRGNKLHTFKRPGTSAEVLSKYESGIGDTRTIAANKLKTLWQVTTGTPYSTISSIADKKPGKLSWLNTYRNIMHDLYDFVIEQRFKDNELSEKLKNLWNTKPKIHVDDISTTDISNTDSATHTEFVMVYDILPDTMKQSLDKVPTPEDKAL